MRLPTDTLEKRGFRAMRKAGSQIARQIITAFRHNRAWSLEELMRRFVARPLTRLMAASEATGRRRAGRGLQLDEFSSLLQILRGQLGPTAVNQIIQRQGINVLQIIQNSAPEIEARIRQEMNDIIAEGLILPDAVERLQGVLESTGVSGPDPYQLKTLVRTNTQLAYNAGKYEAFQAEDIQEILWGYTYVTVGDDRVRPSHAELDGTTLPKDDPFWDVYWPPNGWNCRCQVIAIFEERQIARPSGLVIPDPGFGFNPGQVLTTSV